jgi:predicted GNAT family acetyltransferase
MSRGGAAGSPLRRGKFICTLLPVISRGRGIAGGATETGFFIAARKNKKVEKLCPLRAIISLATRALLSLHPDLATL